MSNSRFNRWEIGSGAVIFTTISGLSAGIGAAIRGTSITESAAVVGLGTGLVSAGVGFFARKVSQKPSFPQAIPGLALLELMGTTLGYAGTKLFINAAASTAPFIDASLGFPITMGLYYCLGVLADYLDQNAKNHLQNQNNLNTMKSIAQISGNSESCSRGRIIVYPC